MHKLTGWPVWFLLYMQMVGNSFERKLAVLKGVSPKLEVFDFLWMLLAHSDLYRAQKLNRCLIKFLHPKPIASLSSMLCLTRFLYKIPTLFIVMILRLETVYFLWPGCRHRTEACAGRRRGDPGYRRSRPRRSTTTSSSSRRWGGHSAPRLPGGLPGSAHQPQQLCQHHRQICPSLPEAARHPQRRRLPRWHGGSSLPRRTPRRLCAWSPRGQLDDGESLPRETLAAAYACVIVQLKTM